MDTKKSNSEREVRKTIIKELPHFWAYSILSGVISLAIQIVGLIPTILMQQIIDTLIPSKNLQSIAVYIVLFCTIPLIATALSAVYKYQLAIICRKMGYTLAIKGFTNLLYQPVAYFDKENSSELSSYCRGESMKYVVFWMIDIPQLVATGLVGVIIFAYILNLNWIIAVLLLLYIPVAFFPSNWFANKVKDLSANIISNNAAMNQIINDTFRGIKFIKSMVLEKLQIEKLEKVNGQNVSVWSKVVLYDNMTSIWVNNFSDSLFTGITFGITSFLIVLGKMTLGSLVVILNYTGQFLGVIKKFMNTNYNFKSQLGEYDKLFSILTMPVPSNDGSSDFKFNDKIEFKNITFAYEKERGDILKSLNLVINSHEWLGIVGSSGAGKTTVFDLLLNFYNAQSGEITVDGVKIDDINLLSLRSKITKVSQDTFLFPGTIRDNLMLSSPKATDAQLKDILKSVKLDKFIENLPNGLDTVIGENGLLLSGGERQRLGLAQGLLRNCEIILLDEVTANIDTASEEEIKNVIKDLKEKRNFTVIAISHRIDFLKDVDRIVILENGHIKAETTYKNYIGA